MNEDVTEVLETPATTKRTPRVKPPVMPTPRQKDVTGRKPITVTFPLEREAFSVVTVPSDDGRHKPTVIYHLYPRVSSWLGRTIPDEINPRSHDVDALRSSVARQIEETLTERPEMFFLSNRGSTVLANMLEYDSKRQLVTLTITNPEDQGLVDGATTDAVIAKVQTAGARGVLENKTVSYLDFVTNLKPNETEKIPAHLRRARLHLEVFTDIDDMERIAALAQGRNTSRQVASWSMAHLRGDFDWLEKILEADKSPFKGKVAWEENAPQETNVLDVLALLTLFHPEFDETEGDESKAPVVAYANKGKMDKRLNDPELRKGYAKLAKFVPDILNLYEALYASFEVYFAQAVPNARLGRRNGVTETRENPVVLPLTGLKSNYIIPNGFLFPILAAFRALINRDPVSWKVQPFEFLEKYGKMLVGELLEQVESFGNNPNVAGKKKVVYTALHSKVQLALSRELAKH